MSTLEVPPGVSAFPLLSAAALGALELLGFPLYIYDFETQRICWSNKAARKFWGAGTQNELSQRVLTPFSASTERRLAEYREAFRRGEDRTESWTFYPRGRATATLSRCSGVSISGHAETMLVEIQELTPVELPVSELRAIEALRHTPLKVSLFSDDGEVLMRNPAALECFREFDRSLAPGADHFRAMFAQPADCERLLGDVRRNGVASRRATIAIDGWPVHSVQVTLANDPVTGGAAMLVAQQDMSELINVTRELAASQDALDAVLNFNITPTVLASVPEGHVLSQNLAARTLVGEVAGVQGMLADPTAWDSLRAELLAGGGGSTQARMLAANGEPFWASIASLRITYDKRDAMVLVMTDVDQLYRIAADLEAALDLERQTSEMQRRFLAIASHEFRTPLALIDSAAQRLERATTALEPDQVRGRATRIRGAVKRLIGMLDNTIERARSNQTAMGYSPSRGRIDELVVQVAQAFLESNSGLQVDVQLPALPELVFDRGLMEQVFVNLLSNAVKYSQGHARVDIRSIVSRSDVQILIRDHGIGVPAEERERIFSDYVRGTNVGEAPGTGLGLAIVSQIMELHGGLIDMVDTAGEGSTFRIVLPRP